MAEKVSERFWLRTSGLEPSAARHRGRGATDRAEAHDESHLADSRHWCYIRLPGVDL